MKRAYSVLLILPAFLLFSSALQVPSSLTALAGASQQGGAIESIQVLRIVSQENKALIEFPTGKPRIIRTGDSIGEKGKIVEIAEGRIVVEERTATGIETVIIRVEGKKQRVERVRKVEEGASLPLRAQ
jgi:hypothetical protein